MNATYTIEIQNEHDYAINQARLIEAVTQVLNAHDVIDGSGLTIVVTTDEDVAALNLDFRGIDSPTDILSFPADDLPDELIEALDDEPPYLGDLIIAYPYASAQAAREGHELDDSLVLLVVHGSLHLLGYDHGTLDERATMWSAQEAALRDLGIPLEIVHAIENAPQNHSHTSTNGHDDGTD